MQQKYVSIIKSFTFLNKKLDIFIYMMQNMQFGTSHRHAN